MLILLTGCGATMTQGSATEAVLCQSIGEALPTRSHQDTAQTQAEIQETYAVFSLACPVYEALVPYSGGDN